MSVSVPVLKLYSGELDRFHGSAHEVPHAHVSREVAMERFIHQQNLELYRKLLADPNDKDEARHQVLLKLLADEKAKDRQSAPVEKEGFPERH